MSGKHARCSRENKENNDEFNSFLYWIAENIDETWISEEDSGLKARRLCSTAVVADDHFTCEAICARGEFRLRGGAGDQAAIVAAHRYPPTGEAGGIAAR
jgi:hypothetical protein